MQEGIVTKSTGSWYDVVDNATQKKYKCRIVGKFRLNGLKLTNPVAVGDKVSFKIEDEDTLIGNIKKIAPRTNYIVRQSPSRQHYLHLLASNVDHVMLFVTIREPNLKPGFIDRYLLMTEPFELPVTIVVNKADLYTADDLEIFSGLRYLYGDIGYNVILVSALEQQGIDEVKNLLKDRITLVSGHSGVGKSTLINSLDNNLDIKTKEISDYSGKGQHTTTFAEMHELSFGGQIIDTPGIKSLSFNNMEPVDVAHNFKEFFKVSHNCKFSNCMHINEPNCAVKEGLETGVINELRYSNYLNIIQEIQAQNYWERNKTL